MAEYWLLDSAEVDLNEIADYTIENFGIEQARVYKDGLTRAFQLLAENPLIGSDQGHIRSNVRRFVHKSHAIYYRLDGDDVLVLRILGPGQDPLHQLLE
ncbi:MAG: type II toxin-antitoxin system RelE/ParE family toxin [Gammaproteobacteria bacterium]